MTKGSINISAPDGSIDLRSLADWFRADETIRGRVSLVEEPIRAGHMGGVVAEIAISVGGSGVASTLARYFFIWLGKHGDRHTARLTLKDENGRQASLDVNGIRDSEALMRKVFEFFADGE